MLCCWHLPLSPRSLIFTSRSWYHHCRQSRSSGLSGTSAAVDSLFKKGGLGLQSTGRHLIPSRDSIEDIKNCSFRRTSPSLILASLSLTELISKPFNLAYLGSRCSLISSSILLIQSRYVASCFLENSSRYSSKPHTMAFGCGISAGDSTPRYPLSDSAELIFRKSKALQSMVSILSRGRPQVTIRTISFTSPLV